MPVLPTSLLIAAAASDSRTLDSRGESLGDAVARVAQSLTTPVKRAATLLRRQNDAVCSGGYIAGCYQGLNAGPSAGVIVGIILGSIAGFLFILWLLWILSNGTTFIRTSNLVEEDDVVISRRRERSHRSHSPRSRRETYQSEMRHSSSRPERIIRQERIVRDVPPPRVDSSRVRETVIVEESRPERRVDGDDIIEVMEEHSSIGDPPPRRKSKRSSGFR